MSSIKTIKNKKALETAVNYETGEVLSNAYTLEDSNLVLMDYEEYIMLSSEAVVYINKVLRDNEKGYLMSMFDMLKTSMNVLHHTNNKPHTTTTLRISLNHTKSAFYKLMEKLHKAGIIWYLSGYYDGKKVKRILINPHIARKRKTFDRSILTFFNSIETLSKSLE